MTITQTVEIPENRRVHLDFDVPREVPTGRTNIILQFPDKKEEKPEPPLKCLIGVETPLSDSLLGVAANLGDVTLDELRDEWLTEKYGEYFK